MAGLRDYAILLLGFKTGLRGVDIRTLRLSDIDWKNSKVKVCQNKTLQPLILPLSGEVMNAVADYILKGRPDTKCDVIFMTTKEPIRPLNKKGYPFARIIVKYSRKANVELIPGRSFHSIRRTFATELSLAGIPLDTIPQLLGHKSIDEDKPYLSYNRNQIAFCSMGFEEIPLKRGLYAQAFFKGGDNSDSRNLMNWIDNGNDVTALLPFLSTYMGHSEITSTLYYVHLLPERIRKSPGIDWTQLLSIYGEEGVIDEK